MDCMEELQRQIDALKLKALQKQLRSQKVAEFGEIGQKTDCQNCGKNSCLIMRELYCKTEVCHFYDKKD